MSTPISNVATLLSTAPAPASTVLLIQIALCSPAGILPRTTPVAYEVAFVTHDTPDGAVVSSPTVCSVAFIAAVPAARSRVSAVEVVFEVNYTLEFCAVRVPCLLWKYIQRYSISPAADAVPDTLSKRLSTTFVVTSVDDLAPPNEAFTSELAAPPESLNFISELAIGIVNNTPSV